MKKLEPKQLKVENLLSNARVWGIMAQFGKPIDQETREYLEEEGLGDGRTRATGCIGWIWSQWLLQTPPSTIRAHVESFVARGMEMQNLSPKFYMRPLHDLYLLHCAIFASGEAQLKKLAECVVDTAGYRKYKPRNDGELYISAWSGMLKHWILGNARKAVEQSEIIWGANRDTSCRAGSKQLVSSWLREDWHAFRKAQAKDFEKLWARGRKDGTVISEHDSEVVVDMDKVSSVQQLWCWAHCGLALLAAREGAQVVTDPFWFPPHALKCVADESVID